MDASAVSEPYQPSKADWLPKRETHLSRLQRWLKIIEPWGIAIALIAFAIDYHGRIDERTRGAWELLALGGAGNSGKIEALEYLNSRGLFKRRQSLTGIELASKEGEARTYLLGVSLVGADMTEANLSGTNLFNADLSGANLSRANLSKSNLNSANLSGATVRRTDFSGAKLNSAKIRGTNLMSANLSEADLGGADLSGASLWGANLTGANLVGAHLRGALLSGVDLSAAMLWKADLSGANLSRTYLQGAQLSVEIPDVRNLTQEQLSLSCGDEKTILPEGLVIPICSEVDSFIEIHGYDRRLFYGG